MTGPVLWYLNRGTGLVLLVVFTLTVVLGVLSTGQGGRVWPRFATQSTHRGLSLLTTILLAAHAVTAVVDEFVDIRWWQALVPFGGSYRPLYLGLGTLALDLTVALGITSLLRQHLGERTWRVVHLTSYLAWGAAVVHTLGIGTDAATSLGRPVVLASVGALLAAVVLRLAILQRTARTT
ncbi:MAG: ferric reductase [Pedococcus sp.]